jgi:nucleotide-binding universal stress UspA family protein
VGKYKKILVAFDGSQSSENALLQSFKLASDEKSWITVATVVPEYSGDLSLIGVGNVQKTLLRQGEELLAKAASIAQREGALIKTVLEEGDVYERLVDLAEAENFSVIVVGRRGKSSLERALVGSVAARVIGHSQRDVLVVPAGTKIGWKNILLATDGSKYSAFATEKAIDFARSYGGRLTAVSVVDVPDELFAEAPFLVDDLVDKAKGYVEMVKKKADDSGVPTQTLVREGESYQSIIKIATEGNADMIVMGSHGRTGLKRLLMGSVTEKVIGHAPCPVLVVKF